MSSVPESSSTETRTWTRVAMVVVRLALLVFLLWTLVSTKFPENTPVAEDSPAPSQSSHTVAEPCSSSALQLG